MIILVFRKESIRWENSLYYIAILLYTISKVSHIIATVPICVVFIVSLLKQTFILSIESVQYVPWSVISLYSWQWNEIKEVNAVHGYVHVWIIPIILQRVNPICGGVKNIH